MVSSAKRGKTPVNGTLRDVSFGVRGHLNSLRCQVEDPSECYDDGKAQRREDHDQLERPLKPRTPAE